MNKKLNNIPGFTAEVSLYQTSGHYRLAAVSTGDAGIHVVPAQRGFITPFGGGNGGGPPPIIVCVPNDTTDPPSDCPSGAALCSLDPVTGDCTPVGKCCKLGPPPACVNPSGCYSSPCGDIRICDLGSSGDCGSPVDLPFLGKKLICRC
jgi:hypothetical protein